MTPGFHAPADLMAKACVTLRSVTYEGNQTRRSRYLVTGILDSPFSFHFHARFTTYFQINMEETRITGTGCGCNPGRLGMAHGLGFSLICHLDNPFKGPSFHRRSELFMANLERDLPSVLHGHKRLSSPENREFGITTECHPV